MGERQRNPTSPLKVVDYAIAHPPYNIVKVLNLMAVAFNA